MKVAVAIEAGDKKAFATAVDWPGWSRSGKTEELAVEALLAYAARYAPIARAAGEEFNPDRVDVDVVERTSGGGATDFGVPGNVTDQDRRPVTAAGGKRLAALVARAWETFETVAGRAPEELRKGPRGGGRDTSEIVDHVSSSEQSYAKSMGIKQKEFPTSDRAALKALRGAILETLGAATDGSPIEDRKWTTRYAAHRIAWHALDHAWEIEDRTEPAG
jgi:hypothetical protein